MREEAGYGDKVREWKDEHRGTELVGAVAAGVAAELGVEASREREHGMGRPQVRSATFSPFGSADPSLSIAAPG
jgi:hypothetical protein